MKKKILYMLIVMATAVTSHAQVKIGTPGNPDPGAVLELDGGTNRGLLMPRLSDADMLAMSTAANGMVVYNTTHFGLYLRRANAWVKLTDNAAAFSLPHTATYHNPGFYVLDLYNTGGVGSGGIAGRSNTGKGVSGFTGQGIAIEGTATSGIAGYFTASNGFPAIQTGTGSVCIGTTSTTKAKLLVSGSWGAVCARFGENTYGVAIENGDPAITFNTYYIGTRKAMADGYGGYMTLSPVTGKFNIYSSPATGTADNTLPMNIRMTLTKEGNMGVQGNNEPHSPLAFADQVGNKIALWGNSPASHYGLGIQASLFQLYAGTSADDIAFGYGSSASFTENMRIKGNGLVGIGTKIPVARLHVLDDQQNVLAIENSIILDDDVRTNMLFRTGNSYTGGIATIGTGSITARMGFFTDVTAAAGLLKERMSILDNGNVGINTVNPSARLEVVGKTKITQGGSDNAALEVSGAIMVSGANKAAFVRTVTAAEVAANDQVVVIDHPMCNNDPNAILIVTARDNNIFWVDYDAAISKWKLLTGGEHISGFSMLNLKTCSDNCTTPKILQAGANGFVQNDKFNILVIKTN